jgi:serine/threonine protein kinase
MESGRDPGTQRERARRNTTLERGKMLMRYRNMEVRETGTGSPRSSAIFRVYKEEGIERSVSLPQYERETEECVREVEVPSKFAREVGSTKILHYLGSGTFSQVFLAEDLGSRRLYAIKTVDTKKVSSKEVCMEQIQREVEILRKVQGKGNVIRFYGAKNTDGFILMYFEYFPGEELFELVKRKRRLGEKESLFVFRQIVAGTLHIHSKGVCHLDLKLENILANRSLSVKIIDFGLAKECSREGTVENYGGTLRYSSPEAVRGGVYNGKLADSWSCGIILFVMINGCFPKSEGLVCREETSARTREMVACLLETLPSKRAYVGEISL